MAPQVVPLDAARWAPLEPRGVLRLQPLAVAAQQAPRPLRGALQLRDEAVLRQPLAAPEVRLVLPAAWVSQLPA